MRRFGEELTAPRRATQVARVVAAVLLLAAPAVACPGDCNSDDRVLVSELLLGINIALGRELVSICPNSDVDTNQSVSIDELVSIVHVVLHGCFATPGPSSTPTVTPTFRPNRAPVLGTLPVYRAYPNEEIRFVVPASDPDGDPLHYRCDELPAGATLDEGTGEFHWIPTEQQVGLLSLPFTVTDEGRPALDVSDFLLFTVRPLDGCAIPDCDPPLGCSSSLPDVDVHCCGSDPLPRVFEPATECAGKPTLFLGRNAVGFGRLQNCDPFRVRNFSQSGAAVVFNLETRCMNTSAPILVHSVMDSTNRFLFEDERYLEFDARDDGFAEFRFLQLAVDGPGPFFNLEGQEANLSVTLVDADGATVREEVRLRLTFTPVPDLPEAAPPQATCPPEPALCQSSGRATLVVETNATNPQNAGLVWRWLDGSVADRSEFGNPLESTSYAFCLYDDGSLVGSYEIPRTSDCADDDCWSVIRQNRFEFAEGDASVTLRSGTDAQVIVELQGDDSLLPDKQLPLRQSQYVIAQLLTGDVPRPRCWQSIFAPPATTNGATKFDDEIP